MQITRNSLTTVVYFIYLVITPQQLGEVIYCTFFMTSAFYHAEHDAVLPIEGLLERTEYIMIYFIFPPIIQSCSVSTVLFTGGRECQILES